MEEVLKYRNQIYGFLALWILFFHVESRVGMSVSIPLLTSFVQKGNMGVDVFLFISGFCLCLSLNRDSNLGRFYSKRFRRVVITYLVISIPFFFWKSIEEVPSNGFISFFYDLSGLSFWLDGCQNAWFVEAILLFYIITPFIYNVVRKGFSHAIILLIFVLFVLIIAHYNLAIFKQSAIAWTRLPIFVLGIVLAYHYPHFEFPFRKATTILFFFIGFCLVLLFPGHLRGFKNWLSFGLFVIPILWILQSIFSLTSRNRKIDVFFSNIGNISLEVYLVHIMILHIFTFYKLNDIIGQWMYLLLPIVALSISYFVPFVSSRIIKLTNSN